MGKKMESSSAIYFLHTLDTSFCHSLALLDCIYCSKVGSHSHHMIEATVPVETVIPNNVHCMYVA